MRTSIKEIMSDEKSNCHDAPIRVCSSDEGTGHYECVKCGEACDVSGEKEHTGRWILKYVESVGRIEGGAFTSVADYILQLERSIEIARRALLQDDPNAALEELTKWPIRDL